MYTPYFTITPQILKNIEEIGQVFGYLKAVRLPKAYQQEYSERVTAETVHASTAIEGNTLTQEQVEQVIKGETVQGIERDIREAKNYHQTLEHIRAVARATESFSQATVLELHHQLLSGVRNDIAGKYRQKQVRVGDYIPPDAWKVPSLMADFIEWLNHPIPQGFSPIIYAGVAHYQLVAIHPFEDGNGRTTRALITLYLLKNGYDMTQAFALESYYNRERIEYYKALSTADRNRTAEGEPDLTYWLEYFTTGFLIEAERAQSRISEYLENQLLTRGVLLTQTQQTILETTAKKGTAQMADYLEKLDISQRGAYKAVQKLVDLGLVTQSGERKGTKYTITEKGLRYV